MSNFQLFNKLRSSSGYRVTKMIADSASFALVLSVILFVVESVNNSKEQKELVNRLTTVQESLSTRYLGLFPEYIDNINVLLEKAEESRTQKEQIIDTIIIFQDVLYYGVKSESIGFRRMNEHILQLADNGCQVFIAYYDPNSLVFSQMIRESMILPEYFDEFERAFAQLRRDSTAVNESKIDSICQELYAKSVSSRHALYRQRYRDYIKSIPLQESDNALTTLHTNTMCHNLDSIKMHYLVKNKEQNNRSYGKLSRDEYSRVTYSDYKNMFKDFTSEMESFYLKHGENIHLIKLKAHMTMSCWLISSKNRNEAIFAFPSKYASDEIGFYSQDNAIASYIHTMLNGVQAGSIDSK